MADISLALVDQRVVVSGAEALEGYTRAAFNSAADAEASAGAAETAAVFAGGARDAIIDALDPITITGPLPVKVLSRAALALISTPSLLDAALLVENNMEGIFIARDYADYVDQVAVDVNQRLYVRSVDDPTKVWVRKFSGPMDIRWFGNDLEEALAVAPLVTDDAPRPAIAGIDLGNETVVLANPLTHSGHKVTLYSSSATIAWTFYDDALHFTNCDVVTVGGLTFAGPEDLAHFIASPPNGSDNEDIFSALRISGGKHHLRNISGSGTRCLIRLDNPEEGSVVDNPYMQGFMPAWGTAAPALARMCPGLYITNGNGLVVNNPRAFDHGSVVLAGKIEAEGDSINCVINGGGGKNLRDNGFYVSTGNFWTINDPHFEEIEGTGIKMRGSYNTIDGGYIKTVLVGASMTGNDTTESVSTANGAYNKIIGVTFEDYKDGVSVLAQDERYARDTEIASCNFIEQSPDALGTNFAAIRSSLLAGLDIHDCLFRDTTGNYAIFVPGYDATTPYRPDLRITDNRFALIGGDGIYTRYTANARIANNLARDESVAGFDFIRVEDSSAPEIDGNSAPGALTKVVTIAAGEVAGGKVTRNTGTIAVADRNNGTGPMVYDNLSERWAAKATVNPVSLAAGATSAPATIAVAGIPLDAEVTIRHTSGIYIYEGSVTAAGTVTYTYRNPTGSTQDPASGTLTVIGFK